MRYASDIGPLAHVAAALTLQWLALAHSVWWTLPAIVVAAHVMAIEHNHAHLSIFTSRVPNLLLDQLMLVACGIPVLFWRVHHLGSHHRYTWREEDWSSPFNFRKAESPHRPIGYRYYQWTYHPLFCAHSVIHILRSQNRRLILGLAGSAVVAAGVSLALIQAFGVIRWLVVMGGSWLLTGLLLGAVNYFEHFNTHETGTVFRAWTFTCRVHNLVSYNSGYHLLHHERPELHWSLLPAVHAADASYCPARFLETGLFPGYRTPLARTRWLQEHGLAWSAES